MKRFLTALAYSGWQRVPIIIIAWCLGFALIVGLLGFKIGGSLSTFLSLGRAARESWRVAFGLTLGTYLFFVISVDISITHWPIDTPSRG
jgi:hypothetical protein